MYSRVETLGLPDHQIQTQTHIHTQTNKHEQTRTWSASHATATATTAELNIHERNERHAQPLSRGREEVGSQKK